MKSILIALVFCCSFTAAIAQNFYLAPSIGFGLSNVSTSNFMVPLENQTPVFSVNPEVSIGYRLKNNLTFSLGLGYLQTGYGKQTDIVDSNVVRHDVNFRNSFSHLTIPFRVGYIIDAGPVFVQPQLGVDAAFNMMRVTVTDISGEWEAHKWDKSTFDAAYNGFSVFGVIQVNVGLPVTDNISLFGAPSFKYMFTNILNEDAPGPYNARQFNYAWLFHVGAMIDLGQ